MTDRYAGVLFVKDGKLQLPPKYRDADRYVVRHTTVTQDYKAGWAGIGWAVWHDRDEKPDDPKNPDLDLDEARLKIYGEEAEIFRVQKIPSTCPECGEDVAEITVNGEAQFAPCGHSAERFTSGLALYGGEAHGR